MFTIGITKGRWNTLLTALQQFKDDYDQNQPMWRILPEFCQKHPRYERMGLRDLCQHDPRAVRQVRHRAPDHRDVPVATCTPAMKPSDAFAHIAHRKTERVAIDALEGRITVGLVTPYPPGIPLLIPGEVFNRKIVDYLKFSREFNAHARASRPTSTVWWRSRTPTARPSYFADCVHLRRTLSLSRRR
jgi:arginine/lysine/ornithine decarboxylase